MITFDGRSYNLIAISPDLKNAIGKYQFLKYNFQSLNLMNNRSCVGNFRFFYFNNYGKLEKFHTPKK